MSALQPISTQDSNASPAQRRPRRPLNDRYIPHRSSCVNTAFELEDRQAATNEVNASPAKEEYKRQLASSLIGSSSSTKRVLEFNPRLDTSDDEPPATASLGRLYHANQSRRHALGAGRPIPQTPERILDAPDIGDDYYLNLLDWNANNILGVALGDSVYLWNATTGSIQALMQTPGESGCHVTSIAWAPGGRDLMAVGTSDHQVQIWDTAKCKLVRTLDGHCGRVGVLSWGPALLSSGGRDGRILHRDTRAPSQTVGKLEGHTHEVCGLKWAPTGVQLASGGNDNLLNVWDERRLANGGGSSSSTAGPPSPSSSSGGSSSSRRIPLYTMRHHNAAVKALAWCPWQKHLLASGGGTADRMIRFWSMNNGACTNAVDTHSQVCALIWSVHEHEIVSSHGFSHNQLILWKYPSMVKASELTGHTARVLHMAASPDGRTVVSAAADETLRFWKILGNNAAGRGLQESVLSTSAWLGSKVVR